MEEAERIARDEHGSEKILVISGVGTRHYYRKLGYEIDGPYMSKMLWLFLKDIFTLFIFLNNNFILGFKNLFHTTKHR